MSRMSGSRKANWVLLSPISMPTRTCSRQGKHRVGSYNIRPSAVLRTAAETVSQLRLRAQLAAGGVDLRPFAFADFDADARLFQRSDKRPPMASGLRAGGRATRDFVKRNQIDMSMPAASKQQPSSRACVASSLSPPKKNVFIGDLPAGLFEEIIGRRHDCREAGLFVGRHDLVAQGIVLEHAAIRPGDTVCPDRRVG